MDKIKEKVKKAADKMHIHKESEEDQLERKITEKVGKVAVDRAASSARTNKIFRKAAEGAADSETVGDKVHRANEAIKDKASDAAVFIVNKMPNSVLATATGAKRDHKK